MECILAFAMLLLLSVVLLFLFVILPAGFATYESLLRHIAKHYGGKIHAGNWLKRPAITFRYAKVPVHFTIEKVSGDSHWWLKLTMGAGYCLPTFQLATAELPRSLQILKEYGPLPPQEELPGEDGRVYFIQSENPGDADLFLESGVRSQIELLRNAAGRSPMCLSNHKGVMTIHKRWLPGLFTNELVMEFLHDAMRVHDQFLLSKAQGIKFVESPNKLGKLEQLKCAICGEALGAEFVQCKRCSAPHHLDCWNYNGSCGTFACKETRYVSAPNSQPATWYRRLFPS